MLIIYRKVYNFIKEIQLWYPGFDFSITIGVSQNVDISQEYARFMTAIGNAFALNTQIASSCTFFKNTVLSVVRFG